MAVWLVVWGKNAIGDLDDTRKYLSSLTLDKPLDLAFLNNLDEVSLWGDKLRVDSAYNPDFWEFQDRGTSLRLTYKLPSSWDFRYNNTCWEFSLCFKHDIISFTGSGEHYGVPDKLDSKDNLKQFTLQLQNVQQWQHPSGASTMPTSRPKWSSNP
jgi:hypothetical protein